MVKEVEKGKYEQMLRQLMDTDEETLKTLYSAREIEPEQAVIITKNTQIEFSEKPAAGFEGLKRISYEDIGGLKDETSVSGR